MAKFSPRTGPSPKLLAVILAGGEGKRLLPLTKDRAKPAVPFGGRYRLIDFALSNFVNSGIMKVKVLTQYKSDSLNTHISRAWRLSAMLDNYVDVVPAQQRRGPEWFKGSADALFQSLNIITDEEPDYTFVFGSDHVYKMAVDQMLDHHLERDAELTVAAIPVPVEEAREFGVIQVDGDGRMIGFEEKNPHPKEMPDRPGWALASMGNYLFNTDLLVEALKADSQRESQHDFGRNILPELFARRRCYVYDFTKNIIPESKERERAYWRDVGTIDAYWQANMDLIQVEPVFDLYNPRWPVRTHNRHHPPAKFVFANEAAGRIGIATDSLVSEGCIISGGRIDGTILSPRVRVNSFAHVEESILFDDVNVGRYARLRKVICDKRIDIPQRMEIGYDRERDRARGFHVSEGGVTVIPMGAVLTEGS
jgi:glucose-1-phosphate adenylyltransferase